MFTEDDLKSFANLEKLLAERVTWNNLSTTDAVQVFRSLAWFSGLKQKIESHIFEIKKVTNPPQAAESEAMTEPAPEQEQRRGRQRKG